MGRQKQKEATQSPNPASSLSSRVQKMIQSLDPKTIPPTSGLPDEVESFVFSFALGVTFLQQDQPCSKQAFGACKRLLLSVCTRGDLLGFIDCCSDLRAELVQCGSWRDLSKGRSNRWVRGVRQVIEHLVEPSLIVHPSVTFDRVATFLGWLKRLPVCVPSASDSADKYYECDRRILSVNHGENVYVPMLREIWREWFGLFKLSHPFLPRHGSGSTADAGKVRHDKWCSLSIDRRGHVGLRCADLEVGHDLPLGSPKRESKVVFVPKQAGKSRTICMEPAWLQYLQQGVARQIIAYTHSDSHPLSRMVDIFSQEKNRSLCARAYEEKLCTIDLSDASDSVSYSLIRELTKGIPLGMYLYATRSESTLIEGHRVRMEKFAPMGSALCFPIECYVFASIVELAHRIHFGQASRGAQSGCSVYGDDIVCPVEIYYLVERILLSLGFLVNTSKSFTHGGYYESCGVEYLYGAKITSIKHPRRHLLCQRVTTPETIGLVTDLSNSFYDLGYFLARRSLLKHFEKAVIRVGSETVPVLDLVRFSSDHLVPVGDPYVHKEFDTRYQSSCVRIRSCEVSVGRAESDFQQWKSEAYPRSRQMRVEDLYHRFIDVPVDPRLSRKAIVALMRYGFPELVRGDEIEAVGHYRTGHLRHRIRDKRIPWSNFPG